MKVYGVFFDYESNVMYEGIYSSELRVLAASEEVARDFIKENFKDIYEKLKKRYSNSKSLWDESEKPDSFDYIFGTFEEFAEGYDLALLMSETLTTGITTYTYFNDGHETKSFRIKELNVLDRY